jgi:cytochrome c-type biogenesis protein CcmF
LVLLVACVAVLSGTLFPVFSEWFTGSRISVGAPFFNKVNIPLGLLLLFLTGVGPLLAWRKTSTDSLLRNFKWPGILGLLGGVIGFVSGFREMFSLICLSLCVFVASTIVQEFYRGAKVVRIRSGASWLASCVDLTLRNTRRYGGYIVHFGMVMIFIGLSGQAFNKEVEKELPIGSTVKIGNYDLLLQSMDQKQEKNYVADRMIVEVLKNDKPVMMLYPERRNFPTNQESGTMVAIYSTLREDLYVVYAGMNPQTNLPTVHAFINPLVKWVWWGGMVVVMGTIVALLPNRVAVVALAKAESPVDARGITGMRPAQVTLREGHD